MLIYDKNILLLNEGDNFVLPLNHQGQGAVAVFRLKELLKSVGWVHQSSGDGLSTFSTLPGNSFDVITSALNAPGALTTPLAWFVLQQPGSDRQICFQRDSVTNDTYWRIKYSYGSESGGFINGSPSPTETPSATDEQMLVGSGTDAFPSFDPWMQSSPISAAYCHIAADDAAPYGWWIVMYPIRGYGSTIAPLCAGVFDPLVNTYPGDLDPYAFYFSKGGSVLEGGLSSTYSVNAWFDHGGANQQWVYLRGVTPDPVTGRAPQSFANNKVENFPVFYSQSFYKGRSTTMLWAGSDLTDGALLQVSAPRDRIVVGWVSFPWDGSMPRV